MTTSTATKITLLKHLVNGRDIDFAAAVTSLGRDQAFDIVRHHGYPDVDKMRWAIDALTKQDNAITERVDHSIAAAHPRPLPTPPAAVRPAAAPSPVQRPAPPTLDGPTRLLAEAAKSSKKRTQALGVKVAGLLADLEGVLTAEVAEKAAREKAERDRAANAQRIAELEAELASLKGKKPAAAKTSTSTAKTDEPPASQIRAWAADNGIQCPPVGRVPKTVREAYDNADHTSAA